MGENNNKQSACLLRDSEFNWMHDRPPLESFHFSSPQPTFHGRRQRNNDNNNNNNKGEMGYRAAQQHKVLHSTTVTVGVCVFSSGNDDNGLS